jgi:hypothetical protein
MCHKCMFRFIFVAVDWSLAFRGESYPTPFLSAHTTTSNEEDIEPGPSCTQSPGFLDQNCGGIRRPAWCNHTTMALTKPKSYRTSDATPLSQADNSLFMTCSTSESKSVPHQSVIKTMIRKHRSKVRQFSKPVHHAIFNYQAS